MKIRRIFVLFVLFVSVSVFTSCGGKKKYDGQYSGTFSAADISGSWTWTLKNGAFQGNISLEGGMQIRGNVTESGQISGTVIEQDGGSQMGSIQLEGTIKKGSVSGNIKMRGMLSGTFTGSRTKK